MLYNMLHVIVRLPWWLSGQESACNVGDLRKMPTQPLGQEDPLEVEMATHSSILPRKSHGQRSLAGYSPCGYRKSRTRLRGINNSK